MEVNSLPLIINSLKKQKTLYKVLTPSIKPPYKFLWEMMCTFGYYRVKGLGTRLQST